MESENRRSLMALDQMVPGDTTVRSTPSPWPLELSTLSPELSSTPSGSSPVTFAPRLLSCLHLDAAVTRRAASLETGLSRLTITQAGLSPARTRGLTRPHYPRFLGILAIGRDNRT